MRAPSALLVVDSNILVSAIMSKREPRIVQDFSERRTLLLTAKARSEIMRLQTKLFDSRQGAERLADMLQLVRIIDDDVFENNLPLAATTLAQAVASKNGSVRDAHILACAWEYHADIWSHDRDFAGTGWPSWSTANLRDYMMDEMP
jgi:predicted nucleic acid-binding protein